MGRVGAAVVRSRGPVVVHLDRAVAIDLLQALTQALEPYASNIAEVKQVAPRGKSAVRKSVKTISASGPKRKSAKAKTAKGKQAKRSR